MGLELGLKQYRQEGACISSTGDNMTYDTEVKTDLGGRGKELGTSHRGPELQAEEFRFFMVGKQPWWILSSEMM